MHRGLEIPREPGLTGFQSCGSLEVELEGFPKGSGKLVMEDSRRGSPRRGSQVRQSLRGRVVRTLRPMRVEAAEKTGRIADCSTSSEVDYSVGRLRPVWIEVHHEHPLV